MKIGKTAPSGYLNQEAHTPESEPTQYLRQNALHDRDHFENPTVRSSQQTRPGSEIDFAKLGFAAVKAPFSAEQLQKLMELLKKSEDPLYFLVESNQDGRIAGITSYSNKADWLLAVENRKGLLSEEVWNAPPLQRDKQLAFLDTQLEIRRSTDMR